MVKQLLFCCLLVLPETGFSQEKAQEKKKEQKVWETVQHADAPPYRVTESTTESNGKSVTVQKLETLSTDGTLQPLRETKVETLKKDAATTISTRQEFSRGPDGRSSLTEVTREERRTFPDGRVRIEGTTSRVDVNGRLQVSRSEVHETLEMSKEHEKTQTTVFVPDLTGRLAASEIVQGTERRKSADVTEYQETRLLPDGNQGWTQTEQRMRTTRSTGKDNVSEEEQVYRKDETGKLSLVERTTGKEWKDAQGVKHRAAETYSRFQGGRYNYADDGLHLDERMRSRETTLPDGGRRTVEEVERRSYAAPTEGLRVEERIVEELHPNGKGALEGKREVQTLDPNGRFVTVKTVQVKEEVKQ